MIYFIVSFLSIIILGFFFQWKQFKKNLEKKESPFELTELIQKTPTPTPEIKKVRKSKKSTK